MLYKLAATLPANHMRIFRVVSAVWKILIIECKKVVSEKKPIIRKPSSDNDLQQQLLF